jgi:thiosulfate dehydrogenase [quinone] large subunit
MARTQQAPSNGRAAYFWAMARIALGITFLWAFFDKLFGLGFATCRDVKTDVVTVMCEKAWAQGASPTTGFLKFATKGPLADFYQGLAGNIYIDILFMGGLLLIGSALLIGIGMRLATLSGVLLMLMMWSAMLFPENNPIIDDHIIYSIVLLGLLASNSSQKWGLRSWWVKQPLVKRFSFLE